MKKTILFLVAFMALTCGLTKATNFSDLNTLYVKTQMDAQSITVYMIKKVGNMWVQTRKSATYDSEKKTIIVDGNTYSVKKNPYYGDDSKRGSYEYMAGSNYYFNL